MDTEGTSHKSRFARVIKGRKGIEELTMVLEEEADVCSIWLTITNITQICTYCSLSHFQFWISPFIEQIQRCKGYRCRSIKINAELFLKQQRILQDIS